MTSENDAEYYINTNPYLHITFFLGIALFDHNTFFVDRKPEGVFSVERRKYPDKRPEFTRSPIFKKVSRKVFFQWVINELETRQLL
jgi:hypothetical protein